MKDSVKLTFEQLADGIIIVECLEESNKKEYYIAIKESVQLGDCEEYTPIARANTKEECLKRGIVEYFTKTNKFKDEFDMFLNKLSNNKNNDMDYSEDCYVCYLEECGFDNFIIDADKIYFSGGIEIVDVSTMQRT